MRKSAPTSLHMTGLNRFKALSWGWLTFFLVLPVFLLAAPPTWWTRQTPPVIKPGTPANDYGAVNQGQLKNFARAAMKHLDESLPGGAGGAVHAMVERWSTDPAHPANASTNDFAPVTVTQAKNVAKPFYDQLIATGLLTAYPWTPSAQFASADDTAMSNIGQVKKLFSFDASELLALWRANHPLDVGASGGNALFADLNTMVQQIRSDSGLSPQTSTYSGFLSESAMAELIGVGLGGDGGVGAPIDGLPISVADQVIGLRVFTPMVR